MKTLLLLIISLVLLHAADKELSVAQQHILKHAQTALQEENADKALAHLQKWQGAESSLQQYLLGYAHYLKEQHQRAMPALQRCLQLDSQHKNAAMLLMGLYAEHARWREARPLLQEWVDLEKDALPLVKQVIYCAEALEDYRWSSALLQKALVRFPQDHDLRRLDAGLLIQREQWTEAQAAVEHLLASQSNDPHLWQYLSVIFQHQEKSGAALAALEAAVLLKPSDETLRLQFAQAQFAAGQREAALAQAQLLLKNKPKENAYLHLAIQAAYAAGQLSLAQTYLNAIDEGYKKKHLPQMALQVYMHEKSYVKLDAFADSLLAQNELSAQSMLWLADNAETRQLFGRAEMLYQLARKTKSAEAGLASLYLARLWHRQQRSDEAVDLIKTHLRQYPEDEHARRLLTLIQE